MARINVSQWRRLVRISSRWNSGLHKKLLVMVFLSLVACGGSGGKVPSSSTFTDENSNGVRDSIDVLMEAEYGAVGEDAKFAKALARQFQIIADTDIAKLSSSKAQELMVAELSVLSCGRSAIADSLKAESIVADITAWSFDSPVLLDKLDALYQKASVFEIVAPSTGEC